MQTVIGFPKPKMKKQHKAKNNPSPKDFDRCVICGRPYAECHEVFGGINRQNSIKYGMQVRLCQEHHTGVNGIHFNKEFMDEMHSKYQAQFESIYGHEKFMEVFGKNYIGVERYSIH